tara:strand:+ start:245 stop:670 length:426 start_codon:yes stop_codon:yes gene_type:complete
MSELEYKIGDRVKINNLGEGDVVGTPNSFMSNGSYEVKVGNRNVWVKEEEIQYKIDYEHVDDIENYFEVIYDEDGVNLIPKNIEGIRLDETNPDFKRIVIEFNGNKHKQVTLHIGDETLSDDDEPKTVIKKLGKPKKWKII